MRLRTLLFGALAALLLAGTWFFVGSTDSSRSVAQELPRDDEIAYIDGAGFVRVDDPRQPSGALPFSWSSPSGGWANIASLDANGDGIDEILAIGGSTARILTPYVPSGTTAPSFNSTIGGYSYNLLATGDYDADGRSDFLLQRTDLRGNLPWSVQIYHGNANGTSWTKVFDEAYTIPWLLVGFGDVDGLAGDEIVFLRNGPETARDRRMLIRKYNPANGQFITIFERVYNFSWLNMTLGNVNVNNGDADEIIITRGGVLGNLPSLLVLQYYNYNVTSAPQGEIYNYPYWTELATGNVNDAGSDAELMALRDPGSASGVSLKGFNWGTDPVPANWELAMGQNQKALAMGDIDGDAKAEVITATSNSYRIFWEPNVNLTNTSGDQPRSFRQPVTIVVGNFDGNGGSTGPAKLSATPKQLNFTMKRSGANPANQTISVTNSSGGAAIAFEVTRQASGNWLDVSPSDGATPAQLTVSINGGNLAPGTYNGTVTISAVSASVQDSPQIVNVRLVVEATGPELGVTPSSLAFNMVYGDLAPSAQQLAVKNIGDGGTQPFTVEVTTTKGGNWLKTSRTSGYTNATVDISVDPTNLSPGTYNGNVKVVSGSINGSPQNIPVTLKIDAVAMVVTPSSMILVAHKGKPSPVGSITIDQNPAGSGGVHWYAYAVPAGDWAQVVNELARGTVETVEYRGNDLLLTAPDGATRTVDTLPWVIITPPDGITKNNAQVSLNVALAPVGDNGVTIIFDGGPGTLDRFQGVDTSLIVSAQSIWLPTIVAK